MVVAGGAVVALLESRTVDIAPESAGAFEEETAAALPEGGSAPQ
jgi:hypothetical protein